MKGETSNGKSKLLEILARVIGGYYHCIQADNLKPGNSCANATPHLASTLFNCRIVTTEELKGKSNENQVKQITGNSCITFRKCTNPVKEVFQLPSCLPPPIIYLIVERPRLFTTESLPFLSHVSLCE
ncbi:SF3 helicase domain-containing protein [Trichonephila inaurata madagascariensis]|uniref:SF3 helicase domain-containing protein n=1 Tax=Trichonephila inaurata madagascariensis TaxID=2747483 RepID=A0A8X6YAV4_9ARAC|nr:SF3 helicase domain-containing protein [Trichonephila inaurata madagascariensis]